MIAGIPAKAGKVTPLLNGPWSNWIAKHCVSTQAFGALALKWVLLNFKFRLKNCNLSHAENICNKQSYLPPFPLDGCGLWWWISCFVEVEFFCYDFIFKVWVGFKVLQKNNHILKSNTRNISILVARALFFITASVLFTSCMPAHMQATLILCR